MTIDKTFDPAAIEARWYAHWEAEGRFRPARPDAEPFTIVIPPPNVTGSLHIGHALDNTLQDILVRHARLKGRDALWVVGTDHAGIATQMVVERNLAAQGIARADMSREEFVAKVWDWKVESGGTITRQLRRLGASCDWANERFTMDEGFTRAVVKVFVDLHAQGLIYRDKRLVNWDPGLGTAISDLEVETREVQGKFWHLRYPLADGSGHIDVSTTRPKTMLADMAVAVHPGDDRYRHLVGKLIKLPITGRLIPIITDEHADPELGTGAVKITPGHDFNDFEVGRRAGIDTRDMLNMLDSKARITQTVDALIPEEFLGLERVAGTDAVVGRLAKEGVLIGVEERIIQLRHGDRSGVVIEPWLTDQWYVDAKMLAGPAIEAVRSGAIRIVPKTWEKTWFQWLENIQPWCVSRQLWWGHRIPAWYGPRIRGSGFIYDAGLSDAEVFVAETQYEAELQALTFYKAQARPIAFLDSPAQLREVISDGSDPEHIYLWRETDVLDTWFSSALWPFATLGWPDDMAEDSPTPTPPLKGRRLEEPELPLKGRGLLARHYPNDVLVSGFDILFFWDARMAMQGLHIMGEVPWKTLYLHGLVRAPDGSKMSKSKGNTVDPLGLIDRYGADALRFTLAAMESQGRDIKLDERRVEGYRNFATKLWNAARFAQSNGIGASATLEPPAATLPVNRWIVAETIGCVQALDLALADLRFDEAANTIYQFAWSRFCDWYLELIKPVLGSADSPHPNPSPEGEGLALETRAVAGWVLDQILVMLHPFMPFVTEELWHALGTRPYDLILAKWPMADARAIDPEAAAEVDWLIRLVGEIRSARTQLGIAPGARFPFSVKDAGEVTWQRLERHAGALSRLARVDRGGAAYGQVQVVVHEATYLLNVEGVIDLDAERARLAKGIEAAGKERDALARRLETPAFVEKAKPEAVAKAREDHAAKAAEAERLGAALARLG